MKRAVPTNGADETVAVYLLEQRFRYEYAAPVRHLRHRLLVLPPLRHGPQRRLGQGHAVDGAAAEVDARTDHHGNTELLVHAPKVATHIEFSTWSRVETRPERPSFVPTSALTDRRWREETSLTAPDPRMQDAAREVSSGDDVLARADEICQWTHAQFTYRFGVTGVRTTAAEALQVGVGVCQDYAHVMIAVCRSAGIAARYASGHLVGEGGSHAWVEVVAPTADGRAEVVAFDPTHGRRAEAGYVTVAVGRDYGDVPPTSGSFVGDCPGRLTAEKRLRLEPPLVASAVG